MLVAFKYYLADPRDQRDRIGLIEYSAGPILAIDPELSEKIGSPFKEIEFDCTLDSDSGEVVITAVNGVPLAK